jgi:ankyrin repeat protein
MKTPSKPSGGKPDAALLKAADEGDLKTVRERLAAGADINAAKKNECPAILMAVNGGNLKVVQALIEAGADINCVGYAPGSSVPSTPLSWAIEDDNWEMADALLKAGADMAVEHVSGDNAVGEAADRASRHFFTLTASEDEWLSSKARTRDVMKKAQAIYDRCMQFTRDAIAKGVKVRDYYLWNAVNHKHAELALLLLSAGVNPNAAPHGSSALTRAIEHGVDEIALAIIKAGADTNLLAGNYPLLIAVQKGNTKVAAALLDAGAKINATGDVTFEEDDELEFSGKTFAEDIKTLMNRAAQRQAVEAGSPLIVATHRGDEAMVKLLIERGADVSIADKQGVTALAWATRLKQPAIVELLKNSGAKAPEFLEGSMSTALWTAAKSGDATKVRDILSRGAKPDEFVEDREGKHLALVSAAREGHLEVVQVLIQGGANVNAVAQEGFTGKITPLMAAARAGRVEAIKALLAAKADVGSKDVEFGGGGGETALHYAARGGHAEAIKTLVAGGAVVNAKASGGRSPLSIAAEEKKYDAVKALLDAGADPNGGSKGGSSPLCSAALNGDLELVKLLIERGADLRVKTAESNPLYWAASKGSVELVEVLLKAGAPVDTSNGRGGSALDSAALRGNEPVVKILLAAGANPNSANEDGFTPLMAALRSGKEGVVRLLLEAGADANAVMKDGRSVLKVVKEGKKRNLIALIEAAIKAKPTSKAPAKKAAPKAPKKDEEEEEEEFEAPDFSEAAADKEFQAALREVENLCDTKPKPLGKIEGGYSFNVPRALAEKLVAEHHQPLLKRGAYLFRSHRDHRDVQDTLSLLPTKDFTDLIRVFQTNGANYDLMPADIAKWLQKLSSQQPFVITGAGWDWLEGRFTTEIKSSRKLAHQLYEFCPDIVDQGVGSVKDLARLLEKDGYFFFWWD